MYTINCGVKFDDKKPQIVCNTIADFNSFLKDREKKNERDHNIHAYVEETKTTVVYYDEFNNGIYDWYVVGGKFLNYLEPIRFHGLEEYLST